MHSQLSRQSHQFEPFSAHNTSASYPHQTSSSTTSSSISRAAKRMTVSQTYRLAHTARGKLSTEAARGDHDLRLLVGHANLLDSLMLDLQEIEREQDAWYNATVKGASSKVDEKTKTQHIQWQDAVIAERELEFPDGSDDEASDDGDSDSEYDDEDDVDMFVSTSTSTSTSTPARHIKSPPPQSRQQRQRSNSFSLGSIEESDDEDEAMDSDYEDDEEDNAELALVRTQSRSSPGSPPELVSDSDESDLDEPVSPPASIFNFAAATAQAESDKPLIDEDSDLEDTDYSTLFDMQTKMIAAAC